MNKRRTFSKLVAMSKTVLTVELGQKRTELDRDRVRERTGLLPQDEYLDRSQLRYGDRGSGRTTEMIVDALVDLQSKDFILIESANQAESRRIVREIRRRGRGIGVLCSDLAAETEVRVLTSEQSLSGYDPSKYSIFTDHSYFDRAREFIHEIRVGTENRRIDSLCLRERTYGMIETEPALQPVVCKGCSNYDGSNYGGNLLICAIHPYGCGDVCPDYVNN